jgi:hypothetical protein
VSTDLFPTFLHAAGIAKPASARIDGTSILNILLGQPPEAESAQSLQLFSNSSSTTLVKGDERVVLWHKDIGGKASAAWSHGYKMLLNNKGAVDAVYDMRHDPKEDNNIKTQSSSSSSPSSGGGKKEHSAADTSSASVTLEMRKDPAIIGKVQAKLSSKLMSFISDGNRAHEKHKDDNKNMVCTAPVPGQVHPLPWDMAPLSTPDF